MVEEKLCSRCKLIKPSILFPKNKSKKDRLADYCKQCHAEYFQENKIKILLSQKAYYDRNKDEILKREKDRRNKSDKNSASQYHKEYRQKNKEAIRNTKLLYRARTKPQRAESMQLYYFENRAEIRAYRKQYQIDNKEHLNEVSREYTSTHKDSIAEYKKQYNREHPETAKAGRQNRRARLRGAKGSFTKKEWEQLKKIHNNSCLCCGTTEPEVKIVPDHVIPLARGGHGSIDNIQPLCQQCNLKKGIKATDYRTIICSL